MSNTRFALLGSLLTIGILIAATHLQAGSAAFYEGAAYSATNRNSNAQASQSQASQSPQKAEDLPEEVPESELAPAAASLDLSSAPPLIRTLYQATRETKEKDILARLQEAKTLLDRGADLQAVDSQGRTALHWAIFGASYASKPSVLVAYEELADAMVGRGVALNRQDVYQDTALDYLVYSPSFELQTLLVEVGATSGFLAAFQSSFQSCDGPTPKRARISAPAASNPSQVEIPAGATLSVRLDAPVYSDRSRTGDLIQATVTYPLCRGGEDIACKPGELLVPPGTKVNGTILFAQKAFDKYSQPRLVLDFSNIVHSSKELSPLYARVLNVDNARETVRNNEIIGIVQPHSPGKFSFALTAVSAVNPLVSYTINGVRSVYGLSLRREILFPAGTDLQIEVVRPSVLKRKETWAGWPTLEVDKDLLQLVHKAPTRTATPKKVPSDVTNLLFLGDEQQLVKAFGEAGWIEANNLSVGSALKAAGATVRQSGYSDAPVSTLLLEGRQPDIVLQKSLNTFAKRHHIRIWKMDRRYRNQDVWIGAATHDIATSNSRAGTKWSHRIDPHIDRERDWVLTDLLFVSSASKYANVARPAVPKKTSNATGDNILTDGELSIIDLAPVSSAQYKSH